MVPGPVRPSLIFSKLQLWLVWPVVAAVSLSVSHLTHQQVSNLVSLLELNIYLISEN